MNQPTTNYFIYAVPVFIGAMLIEAIMTWRRGKPSYSFNDTYTNLACGMGSQLLGAFFTLMTLAIYGAVYDHARLFDLAPDRASTWVLAIVGLDFIYYWWHRWSHTVNVLWASHVVHHQSEEYNLSVALRQSWFGSVTGWVFYLPLALAGVPPALYLLSGSINLLYQFIIHTKATKSFGVLDYLLNTPSHHRVHHGSNDEYLDKNYAGMLIVWDRLFGTFTPEEAEVQYGLVKPLHSWNPIWANTHYWVELWQAARAHATWTNKLLVWVKNPGWMPGDRGVEDALERAKGRVYRKFSTPSSTTAIAYVFVQFLAATAGTVTVMVKGVTLPGPYLAVIFGALGWSANLWEGLLASRLQSIRSEAVRLTLLLAAGLVLRRLGLPEPALAGLFTYACVSAGLLLKLWSAVALVPAPAPAPVRTQISID